MEDILLNKIESIERCISRIEDVYDHNENNLLDLTKLDSIILNIQRACECSIDLANIIVAKNKLGLPKSSRDSFDLLFQFNFITNDLHEKLKKMVGFRNIAIHDYTSINPIIVNYIITERLVDFTEFCTLLKQTLL